MSRRFDTPVAHGITNTEHEFLKAHETWKLRGRPQGMFYFKQKPFNPASMDETDPWGKVLDWTSRGGFRPKDCDGHMRPKVTSERLFPNHLLNFLRDRHLSRIAGISSDG